MNSESEFLLADRCISYSFCAVHEDVWSAQRYLGEQS